MNCLLELCFVSAIYINGGIGLQPSQMPDNYDYNLDYSNGYGWNIGEISGVVEFKNNLYLEVKHISGLNTWEKDDYGLNAIMIGAKIYILRND